MPYRRRVVVVGGGNVGFSLVGALPDDWEVTVIDRDPACLARFKDRQGVTTIEGDASSRLVLEQAALGAAHSMAIVTSDDRVNREVARLARKEFEVEDIVCLLDEDDHLDELGLNMTEVVQRSTSTATLIGNRLSVTGMSGVPLGLGTGELLEVRVLDDSAAVGKQLRDLGARQWLVAAVYRADQLIVPHGATVIEAGDRLLLVGEPEVVEAIAPLLRGGEAVFPSQYGRHLGVFGGDAAHAEALWLAEATQTEEVIDVDGERIEREMVNDRDALTDYLSANSAGAVVIDPKPLPLMNRIGITSSARHRFVHQVRVPVLIARGKHPYRRILVAVGHDEQVPSVAGLAIDIARQCKAALAVLTVVPPSLSLGEDMDAPFREIPRHVARMARIHGLEITRVEREGNPVKVIREVAEQADLLVVGHSPGSRHSLLNPDVSLLLLHDAPCSVMFVPWNIISR